MADIGPIKREIIIEPIPTETPVVEPAPAPAPVPAAPKKEPVPA